MPYTGLKSTENANVATQESGMTDAERLKSDWTEKIQLNENYNSYKH